MQLQFILLKYWYHLCSLEADRIPRKVFDWARKLADKGKKSWGLQLHNSLKNLDSVDIYYVLTVNTSFVAPCGILLPRVIWRHGGGMCAGLCPRRVRAEVSYHSIGS